MQPMLPASDSNSQTLMPAPRLGPIPLMVTHLLSPHLTQEMRDNLASDAFLALPSPAQNATIRAYAQAIETAAAAAQERESIKNKDSINNSAHMQASLQDRVVRLEADVERLDAERLKMLERAVAAEKERDLLKAHVRRRGDMADAPDDELVKMREKLEKSTLEACDAAHMSAHFEKIAVCLEDELEPLKEERLRLLKRAVRAETKVELLENAPALMPAVSPPAAAEAASPKCQASEPPDGAGSPTYARLLEKARHGYLEASVLMQEARHVEAFTRRPL